MRIFTIEDLRSWNPCYDPVKHIPEGWSGTALDILRMDNIPSADKFWVVFHENIIDDRTLRLFAVWCARQVQHLMKDPRSLSALDIAEKFATGEASEEDLRSAWAAARDAARDAAWDAASDAAEAAARASASDAAWNAAWDAARDAAWDAAMAAQIAQLVQTIEAQNG